jgi:hypothetical protein
MSWYKKFLILASFRNKIHSASIECFLSIFRTLLSLYQQNKFESQVVSYQQNILGRDITINIDIRRQNMDGLDIVMRPSFNQDTFSIKVLLLVFNNFSQLSFNKMKNYLFGFVWHEVYHLKDKIDGKTLEEFDLDIPDPVEKVRGESISMLSETEAPAYIVSIMEEAKNSGQKFEDILMEYIDSNFYNSSQILKAQLKSDPATRTEVEQLERKTYNAIMQWAFKRYPLLKERYDKDGGPKI